jgi:hypothetical protein
MPLERYTTMRFFVKHFREINGHDFPEPEERENYIYEEKILSCRNIPSFKHFPVDSEHSKIFPRWLSIRRNYSALTQCKLHALLRWLSIFWARPSNRSKFSICWVNTKSFSPIHSAKSEVISRIQLHTGAEHSGNVIFRYSELSSQYHIDASIDVNRTRRAMIKLYCHKAVQSPNRTISKLKQ